ncbi:MAG: DNA adenine methylase [bacterium]
MATAARHRLAGFLDALPTYFGGKRRLLGHIAKALPAPADAPVLLDPFMGGGSVVLWAKRRGYRVIGNDVADRAVIVGRALVANDRERISRDDLARLFALPADRAAGFVERVHGGEVVPVRHARFLDGALEVARSTPGSKGWLLRLLCLRYVVALRPMGNFGARTIVKQVDDGEWETINPTFLRDHLARRLEAHPLALCEELRRKINRGVFGNGHANEVHQGDAVAFLRENEGDVVYFDPPYGGTSSYEAALKPLDSIIAGEVIEAAPSRFSGRRAVDALEELFAAAQHIPTWVISYGNAVLSAGELAALVSRFRQHVTVEEIRHAHLAGLASEDSKARNREILIRAWGER